MNSHLRAVPTLDRPQPVPTITIRELSRADANEIIDFFEGLPADDRFFRFFRPMPVYPPSMLDFLVDIDGVDHMAVGAYDGQRCLGVARCVRQTDRPDTAEVAVSVAAEARRCGLARRMLDALSPVAAEQEVDRFEINVHPENRKAVKLFRSLGFATAFEDGTIVGSRSVIDPANQLALAA